MCARESGVVVRESGADSCEYYDRAIAKCVLFVFDAQVHIQTSTHKHELTHTHKNTLHIDKHQRMQIKHSMVASSNRPKVRITSPSLTLPMAFSAMPWLAYTMRSCATGQAGRQESARHGGDHGTHPFEAE